MAYAKTGLRAEHNALREKMRELGLDRRQMAAEFARRYRIRPRGAWRHAHGWTLQQAADRINARAARDGLDPQARAAMTAPHLCEYETWPGEARKPSGRKPTVHVLALLAHVYDCAVADLLDVADYAQLPATDRLVLVKSAPAADAKPGLSAVAAPPGTAPFGTAPPGTAPPGTALAALPPGANPAASRPEPGSSEIRAVLPTAIFGPGSAVTKLVPPLAAGLPQLPVVAYRGTKAPDPGGSIVEREVRMAANEGSEHAERAEPRDIGDATLEQLHAEVVRLARDYVTSEPFPLFRQMRRARSQVYTALDRRLWPSDATELYFQASCLNCMMAVAAKALGYPSACEELGRAAWAYAVAIDHHPLMAKVRLELGQIAQRDQPRHARDLAASGLQYLSDGPNAAHLYLEQGRAAARLGDGAAARRAVAAAHDAREREYTDDLLEIEGEFGISLATHHYFAGSVLFEIEGAEAEAVTELETAASLYAAGPRAGEQHWFGSRALTSIDLATIQLGSRGLDAAAVALESVLSIQPAQRIAQLPDRLRRVRAELAQPGYQGSALATELDERIEEFCRETIVADLHELPAAGG